MFNITFENDLLRKYIVLFGTLFDNIWLNRHDTSGNVVNSQKIPITYSPREKLLARIEGIAQNKDPLEQPFATVLPRMGFELSGFQYNSERKLNTLNRFATRKDASNEDKRFYQYSPVPFDLNFDLSIFVKNTLDGTRIIEQIIPYFTPGWTATVQLMSNPDVTVDITTLIEGSVNQEDIYEGNFEERRSLIYTIPFTMQAMFFGPTRKQGVIKLANVNIHDSNIFDDIDDAIGNTVADSRITVYPGQTANGEATTNASLTVDKSEISEDENWDYIVETTNPNTANT